MGRVADVGVGDGGKRGRAIGRRRFLKAGVGAGAAAVVLGSGVVGSNPGAVAGAAKLTKAQRTYSGRDMASWHTVVGDGIWTPEGHDPIGLDDIAARHLSGHSELTSNVHGRPAMAHNITFLRVDDPGALGFRHRCTAQFKIPSVPSVDNLEESGQTLELAFFTWDGSGTRLDYGSAVQWMLNPWLDSFGDLRVWSADGTEWLDSGHRLPLHRGWHNFDLTVDHPNQQAFLRIDSTRIDIPYSATSKAETWGTDTGSRFAIEAINAFPGNADAGPTFHTHFRNWTWDWLG